MIEPRILKPGSVRGGGEFRSAVLQAIGETPGNQALALRFLDTSVAATRLVIGRNQQSEALAQLLRLDGLIDDYGEHADGWHGIPVMASVDVPSDAIVVNCSTSISPVAVFQHLEGLGIQSIVNINELTHAAQGRLEWPWFVRQQRQDYGLHARVWEKLYGRLADDESQQTLLDVLRYRLTGNIRYLWNYSIRLKDQYFEDFMTLTAETFVDAGGFDGDWLFC